jgi:aminopeptidase N
MKKLVASVIAHEMAHQWFGDLVTMQWWDYKWLNEGFATWMSNKPVAAWKPEWHVQLDAVSRDLSSLDQDSLVNTHPIHQRADTPAEIMELDDSITYGKTAAVLEMMESYLGAEPFRAGVNLYLRRHSYANATASDFWNAETEVSGKPADKIMPAWIEQAGAPILTVQTKCLGKSEKVILEQQRYFYDRSKLDAGSAELWQIPLCLKAPSSASPTSGACKLLAKKQESFTVQGCSPWIYVNANAKGFFRVSYNTAAIQSMAKVAERALSPAERLLLLSDVWASVAVEHEPIGDYLELASGLGTEQSSAVLKELLQRLTYIRDYVVSDGDREHYDLWVRQLLAPMAQNVGWAGKPGELDDQTTVRAELLDALGGMALDPQAQAFAQKLANQYLDDPDSVDHGIAAVALRVASHMGDEALYNKIMQKIQSTGTPEAYFTEISALVSFSEPQLVERTLEYAISAQARSQDAVIVIFKVMENPDAAKQAWSFVQENWSSIEKLGGPFAGGLIVRATGGFCDPGMRDEVQAFFTSHPAPAAERTLKQSIEQMNYCVDLKTQQRSQLASWLASRSAPAAK